MSNDYVQSTRKVVGEAVKVGVDLHVRGSVVVRGQRQSFMIILIQSIKPGAVVDPGRASDVK